VAAGCGEPAQAVMTETASAGTAGHAWCSLSWDSLIVVLVLDRVDPNPMRVEIPQSTA
jgi:hypothetical protein